MSTAITIKVCATDERAVVLQRYWDTTRTMFELSQGKPIYATVDLHDRRSNAQNRMFWALWTDIAIGMGQLVGGRFQYTKQDAHDRVLQEICGIKKRMVGSTEVIETPKTSNMNKAEASHVIEQSLAWAAHRGIAVHMPDDYLKWAAE